MIDLLKLLKVCNHNIQVLHRNLIGEGWFADHSQLGEYYDKVQEIFDDLCEIANGLGIKEPTMEESFKGEIEIKDRYCKESYTLVRKMFEEIIVEINRIKDVPTDVINKLQEYQYYFRKETDFKLSRAVKD